MSRYDLPLTEIHANALSLLERRQAMIRAERHAAYLTAATMHDLGVPLPAILDALGVKRATYFRRLAQARHFDAVSRVAPLIDSSGT